MFMGMGMGMATTMIITTITTDTTTSTTTDGQKSFPGLIFSHRNVGFPSTMRV